MVEGGEGVCFAGEPRQAIRIAGEGVGQNLQRNVAIEFRVARPIHLSHTARSEGGEDLVRADVGAGNQTQARGLYEQGGKGRDYS